MAYFLILDADLRRKRSNLRIVSSSENLADLILIRTFTLAGLYTIDAKGLSFTHLRSVDLIETDVVGNPVVPAALYAS